MTRERQRIKLERGLSIYREYRMFKLDVTLGGVRYRRSLHTTSTREAINLAYEFLEKNSPYFQDLPAGARSDGVDRRMAAVISSLKIHYPNAQEIVQHLTAMDPPSRQDLMVYRNTPEPSPIPSDRYFDKALEDHLIFQRDEGNGKEWLKNIESTLRAFQRWSKITTVVEITPDLLARYRATIANPQEGERQLGDDRISQIIRIIKRFCWWLVEIKKWLPADPSKDIRRKKVARKLIKIYSTEEVEKILRQTKDPEDAAAFAAAIYAGPRREELFLLEPEDLDLDGRTITIHNRDGKATKTGLNRQVPILDQLHPFLKRLPLKSPRVFTKFKDVDSFGQNILEICKKITGRDRDGLHVARHTCLTWWIKHGVSPGTASDWASSRPETIEQHYRGRVPLRANPLKMSFFGRQLVATGIPEFGRRRRAR